MAIVQRIRLSEEASVSEKYGGFTVKREYKIADDSVKTDIESIYANWIAYRQVDGEGGNNYGEKPGDFLPGNYQTVCSNVRFQRAGSDTDGTLFYWKVTVEFKPRDSQSSTTVTDLSQQISFSDEENEETDGRWDADGNLNVNSAGYFLDKKLPMKNHIHIYSYSADLSGTDAQTLYSATGKVNSDNWFGRAAGTCLLRNVKATKYLADNTPTYKYKTSWEVAYDPTGWKYLQLDCGTRDNNGIIYGEKGEPIEESVPLDGTGEQLDDGNDPVFLEFNIYESVDFDGLPISEPTLY